ncbi:E3 ubiquitin-protein ligase NEURL1B isoform X1 [Melanotaenia boesemani]|uniref:E3 ubiquitin-protein ligase NEURL1B isoform X1 n=1 Tax=Melanotaenia boesemani TaxID=1250792 RepID=UPI001C054DF4|nr:E3 ubiquitin-protein ligase NEURL1B isoform X1 [Melanotaenia boesemani]
MGSCESSNFAISTARCRLPLSTKEKKHNHNGEDATLQPRPVASRQYYTLPNNGSGVERRASAPPVSISLESTRFHPHAKGKNIRLDGQLRRATRKNSFCNGITFSHRPVHLYEKVRLRLTAVHTGWSGALRFGFTSLDPSELVATDIPKYACPDLVTRPGYWAKALPERLALKDNVLAFWADRHGRVFYSINDGEPILFHCGLSIGCPLWAIIDIYGITQEVTLLDSTFAESVGSSCLSAARLSAYLPQSSHDSANYSNNQLENNQAAAKMANLQLNNYTQLIPCCSSSSSSSSTQSSSVSTAFPRMVRGLPSLLDNDLHFHPVRGSDVILSADRSAACIHFLDSSRTLVFSDRPLHVGETLYVEVGHLGLPYFGALSFGLTSCDPACLHAGDLPADPEVLLDRKEYWVVHRGFPMPCSGDVLNFSLLSSGEVHHGVNGVGRGRLLCVDSSQVLWAFFTLHGAVNRLRILGTLQSSPPPTSPTTSQSSSPDDSDSDLAFSVNRSSSASESSLVTAPSSPLSPPTSPWLPASELPSAGKNGECTICFDQEVDTVIYTCGHMCLCNECGLRLKRQINACCPICRRPIKDVIKTYRP